MNRAYAFIEQKSIDVKRRTFKGMATTPETDRMGDVVNPMGAKFRNPVTLLHQHKHDAPIGTVKLLKPTAKGIEFEAEIPVVSTPGPFKDRVDTAWEELVSGVVSAVSIGFAPIKYAFMDGGGIDFQEIEIYELSTVSVPANAGARITAVKSMDKQLRQEAGVAEPDEVIIPTNEKKDLGSHAALGTKRSVVVHLAAPGASGKTPVVPSLKERQMATKSIADQIAEFEETLRVKKAERLSIMNKSTEEGVTLDAEQEEKFDELTGEVKSIEKHIGRLNEMQADNASTAKPVGNVKNVTEAANARAGVQVKAEPKLEPGIAFARMARVKALARLDGERPLDVAKSLYGENSIITGAFTKAAVAGGANVSGNWAVDLVSAEGGIVADFAAFLRPATILGRFGANGVPSLRRLPFRTPVVIQTGGGQAYWVGEGKAKPLTSFDFDRTTMEPLKVANIAVLTEESLRDSSPSSEMVVRDSLRDALAARLDIDFTNPAKTASAGVSPASITNGAATIAAVGSDDTAVRLQVRALFQKFITANNAVTDAVWIMSSGNALALSMMVNALGQDEFPGINMMGGTFMGLPVIVSDYISNIVILAKASDIYLADEGATQVDMSREASLEMSDAPAQDSVAGTGASLVSLWQTNSIGLRAERTISWKRRRPSAVAYLTGVNWGGEVPNS